MSNRPSSVRVGIRGDRVGMATKAALEPSQLENHITSLMRASFGRLKVVSSSLHPAKFTSLTHFTFTLLWKGLEEAPQVALFC